ncbi:DNA mismatch repair protein MutL [Candidatus Kryptonium thompsonii]|jgi:DNA mismatch repair protein MutL|uniref:DNA mismatch repair protein MutL n=1 Tax=Candidatus Kryptonium thompsonii TaxID=1633631 RepID=A0A0P1ME00_9BACT|nr:DNA mismatch repair endonuclease MutL [Candidatus Kryptonium thompsoni]CUS79041.1 DNA mismatch repair protein MutL [Candidatus Kryptonium thompsoni]CUS86253.1 DNA mismatch repair protein MutL [Candidatus Kryptonium thompsoni]CUS87304.1 DNA mismatch repair protein MutL [Candidatus Kryptonium thompsoni]CUS87808.1 DNA mismatch repair protein MutL [Candidatus Kryptonium thompsoni]CUS93138.1 DNA mismatch repair protein MutL [Candidatus Kryptonium thompsoni]
MGQIRILPEEIASKIAAGEVIQRPESVVKELIENSIDAGAKNITVILKDAGKTLVQVIDDGCGMSEDDAVLAFERHATSKIRTYEDLENIQTLGFRGEALASIAAVSKVEMKTRTPEDELATLVKIEGGKLIEVSKTSHPPGTSIAVKNLFFNTPARRNFLKSNYTEFKHAYEAFIRFAIAYPDISFELISDDEPISKFEATDFETRIKQIFGDEFFETLIPVSEKTEYISIYGFISKPEFSKKTKADQFVFLNRRYIINRSINHAVYNAYEHLLEKGNFPSFILMISINPRHVDVNVHPSKLEVKFDDEQGIYNFVRAVVKHSLAKFNLIPEVEIEPTGEIKLRPSSNLIEKPTQQKQQFSLDLLTSTFPEAIIGTRVEKDIKKIEKISKEIQSEISQTVDKTDTSTEGISFMQIHNKYIIAQIKTGIMIIDQHVAHERILYERALDSLNSNTPFTQQLLFPQTIELTPADMAIVKELKDYLEALGFDLRIFGKNTVILYGVPPEVKQGSEKTILQEIIELYKENSNVEPNLSARENLAKAFACKTAIKAGNKLTLEEIQVLIDQLFLTRNPYVCPHGRPIIIKISIEELDKRFGRT